MISFSYKIEHEFNSSEDFKEYLLGRFESESLRGNSIVNIERCQFNFTLRLPFTFTTTNQLENNLLSFLVNCKTIFQKVKFTDELSIFNSKKEMLFLDTAFLSKVTIQNRQSNLTFKNCRINNIDFSETVFGSANSDLGKLRIKSSNVYETNFKNAKFYALVDFYYTTFHKNVIFYKTDFLNIVVLSATNFKRNILFTYTLLSDKVIMRSTVFHQGFDFSLSIIKGQLSIFDLNHDVDSYISKRGLKEEKEYEYAVSYSGEIPVQNKLETYRLLKLEFEKQQNIPEYLNFKLYEKDIYKKILNAKKLSWGNAFDQITLWLNRISNKFGTSYVRALFFVVIVGWIFFYMSLISTTTYRFSFNILKWDFQDEFGMFIQFLIPTHKFNYLGEEVGRTSLFYLFDFLGRLFVGYGVYQFIQAFRKFK